MKGLLLAGATFGLMTAPPAQAQVDSLPPKSQGTLRRGDVSVRIATDAVVLEITPLHRDLLRLLAPDTYRTATSLLEEEQTRLFDNIPAENVFPVLVTCFGIEDEAVFFPDDLSIRSRNQLFRPVHITSLSPTWHQHTVRQGETTSAIYLFTKDITLWEPMSFIYAEYETNEWRRIIPRLERERARVGAADAAADTTTTSKPNGLH